MHDRIDLRWILATTVVVAVAAAGTAATMREIGRSHQSPESSPETSALSDRRGHPVAQAESARLSHSAEGPAADLPAFQSEALPPALDQPVSSRRDAASAAGSGAPAWGSQRAAGTAALSGSSPVATAGHNSNGIKWPGGSIASNAPGSSVEPEPVALAGGNGTPGGASSSPVTPGNPGATAGSPAAGGTPAAPPATSKMPEGTPSAPPAFVMPPVAGIADPAPAVFVPAPSVPPFDGGGSPGGTVLSTGPGALSPTPEPGSLILIGTGLVSMAGALRRRLKSLR